MAMRLIDRREPSRDLEAGDSIMDTISNYGVEELDAASQAGVTGGNPVALAIAMGSAFVWGFRWGYNVAGPWLVNNT
jgi:hypothetical protein